MKIAVGILAYDNYNRVLATMERFEKETDLSGLELSRHVFYCPYPLPSQQENYDKILEACSQRGWLMSAIPNGGQDSNLMRIGQLIKDTDADIYVSYDTDIAPRNDQWLKDTVTVFKADPKVGFVTINCKCTDDALCQQKKIPDIGNVPVHQLTWPGGLPLLMFRTQFLANGYQQYHSYYGGTELGILEALTKAGQIGVMLSNHDDGRNLVNQDPQYHHWKHFAITRPNAVSFEQWLHESGDCPCDYCKDRD